MRSIRLAVLSASTLFAVLLLAPGAFTSTAHSLSTDATLAPSTALAQTPVSFTGPTNFPTGSFPASVAVGDFNGDGKPDLADANARSGNVSVLLNSTVTNRAPTAAADAYSTAEDTTLSVAAPGVLANDSDVDGDPLTAALATGPVHGALTLNANGSFTYAPTGNFNGSDSFTYKAGDGTALSSAATVTVTVTEVNDSPTAVADAATLGEDASVAIDVTANDTPGPGNEAGQALSVGSLTQPAHGQAAIITGGADAGKVRYTPAADYNGPDSFTYTVCDDGTTNGLADAKCDTASVAVTITAGNDAPVARDDSYATDEDTTLTVPAPGVLANDSDVDGDPLTAALVTGPAHATLTMNANGSFAYTPAANFNGTDSFTYRTSDGTLASGPATVTIAVTAVNDGPTVTVASGGTCGSDDHPGTINLTVGDVDSAATALTLSAASSNPTLLPNRNLVSAGSGATRTLTASAVAGRSGTATVTVTVSDG
jgi:VCBS repeat-containing protein